MCEVWKRGQVTWGEYRDTVQVCRDRAGTDKAHQELDLMRGLNGHRKGVYRQFNMKRKTQFNMKRKIMENVHLLQKCFRGPPDKTHGR